MVGFNADNIFSRKLKSWEAEKSNIEKRRLYICRTYIRIDLVERRKNKRHTIKIRLVEEKFDKALKGIRKQTVVKIQRRLMMS